MKEILVIFSGQLCNPELQQEFGPLPSAFVPVSNRRLFQLQLEYMNVEKDHCYMVMPEHKMRLGREFPSNVITIDPNLSLEKTFVHVLKKLYKDTRKSNVRIHALWGDTLVTRKSNRPCVGVSSKDTSFGWKSVGRDIFNGYLCFDLDQTNQTFQVQSNILEQLVDTLPRQKYSSDEWFDFGHSHTYWISKARFLQSRSFNEVSLVGDRIIKKSDSPKLSAEMNWYRNLPSKIRMYTPQVSVIGEHEYHIGYVPAITLSELYVYGMKSDSWWKSTLSKVLDFVYSCQKFSGKNTDPLFLDKMNQRHLISPWYSVKTQTAIRFLRQTYSESTLIHGDLCFSNILYDSRSQQIKVIDPRGMDSNGKINPYGSVLYDLAKIYHSLVGGYDFIMAHQSIPHNRYLQNWFLREVQDRFGVTKYHLTALTGLLFTSMVPLHMDDPYRARRLHERGVSILNRIPKL